MVDLFLYVDVESGCVIFLTDIISGNVCNSASPLCSLLNHLELSGPQIHHHEKRKHVGILRNPCYRMTYILVPNCQAQFELPSGASKEPSPTFLATAAPGGAHHCVLDVVKLVPLRWWYHGSVRWQETELSSCVLGCSWLMIG